MEGIYEIREDGYEQLKKTIKFGDIIEDGWLFPDSPRRFGIVVRLRQYSIMCTNGEDDYWDILFNADSLIKIHGNTLNDNYVKIKNSRNKSGSI